MAQKVAFKDRAADKMRLGMGTWTAFFGMLGFMGLWMATGGFGFDKMPFILLNLALSTLAGLQGVILLIASKRSDANSEALVQHIASIVEKIGSETDEIDKLIIENTKLTEAIHRLVVELHTK